MTIDWYVYWIVGLGLVAQAWLGWHLGKLLVKAAYAIACAISVCRWGFAVGRVHGFARPAWKWVPELICVEWWAFFTSSYHSIVQHHRGGTWSGIGKWTVRPKREGA